jgi:hypothetical protein
MTTTAIGTPVGGGPTLARLGAPVGASVGAAGLRSGGAAGDGGPAMGGFARLRVAEPGRWRAAAAAWRSLARWTGRCTEELRAPAARLTSTWRGAAAVAAGTRMTVHGCDLEFARVLWWQTDQALSEFAAGLARARALLDAAVAEAARASVTVDAEGGVAAGPATSRVATAQVVARIGAGIAAALELADRVDAEACGRLAELITASAVGPGPDGTDPGTDPGADLSAVEVPATPPCGATPAAVRRWWDGLTPAGRRRLVVTQPEVIGPLDGIPAAYRDLANRLRLDRLRAEVERASAASTGAEHRRLQHLRAGLDLLADRLADDPGDAGGGAGASGGAGGHRAYLLGLDPGGDGRAVIAVGDPDRAANVLTHVPGMTSDVGSSELGRELGRVDRVAARAGQLAPDESTSAVLWLDYDAPDFVDEAIGAGRARDGRRPRGTGRGQRRLRRLTLGRRRLRRPAARARTGLVDDRPRRPHPVRGGGPGCADRRRGAGHGRAGRRCTGGVRRSGGRSVVRAQPERPGVRRSGLRQSAERRARRVLGPGAPGARQHHPDRARRSLPGGRAMRRRAGCADVTPR